MRRSPILTFSALVAVGLAGCQSSKSQMQNLQAQMKSLAEQNKSQLVELQNLKSKNRQVEDQLAQAEQELTAYYDQARIERPRPPVTRRSPTAGLWEAPLSPNPGAGGASPFNPGSTAGPPATAASAPRGRLAELARKHPHWVRYDAATGACQFLADMSFDSGKTELKPSSQQALRELSQFLAAPEVRDLTIMIVGHTDDRPVSRRDTKDTHRDNQQLSVARALAAQEYLGRLGVASERMSVMGHGAQQPLAANDTPVDRQLNRRVEIFLVAPETPVIGRK